MKEKAKAQILYITRIVAPRTIYLWLQKRLGEAKPRGCGYIHLHCVQLLHMAYRSRDAARKDLADRANEPDAATADAINTIVMATVAAEAFINELPEHIETGRSPHLPRDQWAATREM